MFNDKHNPYKVDQQPDYGHRNPLVARSKEPVTVATLGGVLYPAADAFRLDNDDEDEKTQ